MVLLPAPLGPMKPKSSPASIFRLRRFDGDVIAVRFAKIDKFDHVRAECSKVRVVNQRC